MSEELSFPAAPHGVQSLLNQDALAAIGGLRPRPLPEPIDPGFPPVVVGPVQPGAGSGGITAQPSSITAGVPSVITLSGSSLSPVPYGYYLTGSTGRINAVIQVLQYSPDLSQVTLQITAPASTPGGGATLVVQQTRPVQIQIYSAVPTVPRVDSVQPFQIPVGIPTVISVTGLNLPSSGYYIAAFGPIRASLVTLSPSTGSQITLQVTVPRDQLLPNGAYNLFAQGGSQGAPILLYNA